jgi:TonB-dependent starch-binding outer membrane protein SusC
MNRCFLYSKKLVLTVFAFVFCCFQIAVTAQTTNEVKGQVNDENGLPISGASIVAKNLKTNFSAGANSDSNGIFKFVKLPAGGPYSFTISGIQYETQILSGYTLKETSNISLLAKLKLIDSKLDEVVVIGYGEQARSKVVGAVSKIKGEELQNRASATVDQQLAGKLAGVQINQTDGQPGQNSQIIIRGTGTLTAGANPLLVVDGFPLTEGTSLSAINPNDIEDINILKDAASAAIYGSRAANGVVLITTKKGKSNGEFKVSLNTYIGSQQQSSGVKLADAYEFAKFLSEARDWGYVSKDLLNRSVSDPNSVRVTKKIGGKSIDGRELILPELIPYLNGTAGLTNTNWTDEAFRNALIHNYDLAISGGNDKGSYYTSLGYFNQEGVVIGTDLKRYSASIVLENKFSKKVKVGLNIKPSFSVQNFGDQNSRSSGALALIPLSFPYYTAYKSDGSLNISDQAINETRLIEGVNINGTPVENLVATSLNVTNKRLRFKTFGNAYINAEIFPGLTYQGTLGGDYDSYSQEYYYPSNIGAYRSPAPRSDANGTSIKMNTVNYVIENTLNYKLRFKKNSFNLLVGHTFQKENSNYTSIIGTGFPDNNIQNVAGASAFTVTPNINIWTLESYLSRFQYDFDSKYLISVAIRKDGSSRFGLNNRWGNFPSISLGWILSKESFFPKNDILTFAKLSSSWGKTGNNQIGNYSSLALVTNSNYVFGTSLAPGYITTTAPNPDLGWEMASSLNFGIDLGLFKNKLNVSLAYYKTNTTNLLLNVPVPQQTGYTTTLANIGEMENKGFEFQINTERIKLGKFNLSLNANLTTYSNKVISLGPGQVQIATGTDQSFITRVGQPIAEIYTFNSKGVYKTQQEIDASPHLAGTFTGDLIIEDIDKNGVIDNNDRTSKGNYAPELTYGFGANIGYQNFTFSFSFNGIGGRTIFDGDMYSLTEAGEGFAVPTKYYYDNRYHPTANPNGFLGQPNFGNFSNSRKLTRSANIVEKNNGDYLRVRDIQLAYEFGQSFLKKTKLSKFQIYISANNLFTITKFRGWNSDGTSSNVLTSGFSDGSNYPISKTILFGIKITY